MVRTVTTRAYELLRDEGIHGVYRGVKRFLWWQCGGKTVEYWLRTRADQPISRSIGGMDAVFHFASYDEYKRIKTLSGERRPLEWFVAALQPTDTVWDVGANVGVYSVFAAIQASEVVAFEPHPANQQRLRENAGLNGFELDIRPVALSDNAGTAALSVEDHEAGAGGGEVANCGDYEIDLVVGADIDPAPDALKVDVEGHEVQVLKGLGKFLSDVRVALIEVHDQDEVEEVREVLEAHGFDVEEPWLIGTRIFLVGT